MTTCNVPFCTATAVVELIAKQPGGIGPTQTESERTFAFCLEHGAAYYAAGYDTVDGLPYQAQLV